MGRRLLIRAIPRDGLPESSDARWDYWARDLRRYMERRPVDWVELMCFAVVTDISPMAVRNLIAHLEQRGYAVSFRSRGVMRWCGCDRSCADPRRGCPKFGSGRA